MNHRDILIDTLDDIDPHWQHRYLDEREAAYAFGLEDLLEEVAAKDDGEPEELDFNKEPTDSWPTTTDEYEI